MSGHVRQRAGRALRALRRSARRLRSPRCLRSHSSRCSGEATAASTRRSPVLGSTWKLSGSCSLPTGHRAGPPSSPSTPRPSTAAMPRRAPSEAFTTRPPNTRPASRSWRDGPTSGSVNSTGRPTAGPPRSTRCASRQPWTRRRPRSTRSAGYDAIALGAELAGTRTQVLVRISSKRVFHPDPTPRAAGAIGRSRRHGTRFALSGPESWTKADAELMSVWHGLHPKLHGRGRGREQDEPPIVRGSVIRVEVEHLPRPIAWAKKTLWLWWSGDGVPDLDLCWRAYLWRFDIERT